MMGAQHGASRENMDGWWPSQSLNQKPGVPVLVGGAVGATAQAVSDSEL